MQAHSYLLMITPFILYPIRGGFGALENYDEEQNAAKIFRSRGLKYLHNMSINITLNATNAQTTCECHYTEGT